MVRVQHHLLPPDKSLHRRSFSTRTHLKSISKRYDYKERGDSIWCTSPVHFLLTNQTCHSYKGGPKLAFNHQMIMLTICNRKQGRRRRRQLSSSSSTSTSWWGDEREEISDPHFNERGKQKEEEGESWRNGEHRKRALVTTSKRHFNPTPPPPLVLK